MQVQYLNTPSTLPRQRTQTPSRATSRASSYHTVNEQFVDAPDSLSHSSTTPPTSIDSGYEVSHSARQGKVLVIEHPTQVSFVPTSFIQTAVSVTEDRLVIDTILPPTAILRASDFVRHPPSSSQNPQTEGDGGWDATELLKRHELELMKMLKEKLTENYDPTGTIKGEILMTLTGVTRFPNPKGMVGDGREMGKCPCICCQVGCKTPLEPWGERRGTVGETKLVLNAEERPMVENAAESITPKSRIHTVGSEERETAGLVVEQPNMSTSPRGKWYHTFRKPKNTEETRSKNRRSFLARFSRSHPNSDLDAQSTNRNTSTTSNSNPAPAPALPGTVTRKAVPEEDDDPRRKSLSDLVRRRRASHLSSRSSLDGRKHSNLQVHYNDLSTLPTRSSFQGADRTHFSPTSPSTNTLPRASFPNRSRVPTSTSMPTGRFSLDSDQHTPLGPRPVLEPYHAPVLPSRTSSKLYAHSLTPPSNTTSALKDRRSSAGVETGAYGIAQIAEEDESSAASPTGGQNGNIAESDDLARRQSRLMSSYELPGSESSAKRTVAQRGTIQRDEVGLAL